MKETIKRKVDELREYRILAEKIYNQLLEQEEIREKLNTISRLEKLREMENDREFANLKEYKEVKAVCKKLYITVAKTLIDILNSQGMFSTDSEHSFNLTDPIEQMLATEYIKLLPNAYIGGPMKAAAISPFQQVHAIVADHYSNLPGEVKYSDIFPSNFAKMIRTIRPK